MPNEDKKVSPFTVKPFRMNPARAKKETIVAEISNQLQSATGVVFVNYQGLTHKQIEELKKALKEASATFTVTKNTLLKLSLDKSDTFKGKVSENIFNDPTAVIFISGDPVEALKKLAKATKDFGFPKLKSGVLDGATLDEAQLIKLSTLPNRNTLIAQFVGTLNSPIQGLVVVLNGNLQKLVYVLKTKAG